MQREGRSRAGGFDPDVPEFRQTLADMAATRGMIVISAHLFDTQSFVYKGMMLDGVPNFAFTVGYTNASWTLKADLTAEYVRLNADYHT